MLLLLASAFTLTIAHASIPPRQLAPPPKSFKMYSKVSGLWQGNKNLYCSPLKAIAETIKEIKQLHEVKTALFDARAVEIQIQTRNGAHAAIDVDNIPKHRPGDFCVR